MTLRHELLICQAKIWLEATDGELRAFKILQIEQQPRKKLLHGCIRPMGVPSNGLKLLCRPHSANAAAAAAAVGDKSVLEKATTGQTLDTGCCWSSGSSSGLGSHPISLSLPRPTNPPSCIFWTAWIKHSNVSGNWHGNMAMVSNHCSLLLQKQLFDSTPSHS